MDSGDLNGLRLRADIYIRPFNLEFRELATGCLYVHRRKLRILSLFYLASRYRERSRNQSERDNHFLHDLFLGAKDNPTEQTSLKMPGERRLSGPVSRV